MSLSYFNLEMLIHTKSKAEAYSSNCTKRLPNHLLEEGLGGGVLLLGGEGRGEELRIGVQRFQPLHVEKQSNLDVVRPTGMVSCCSDCRVGEPPPAVRTRMSIAVTTTSVPQTSGTPHYPTSGGSPHTQ